MFGCYEWIIFLGSVFSTDSTSFSALLYYTAVIHRHFQPFQQKCEAPASCWFTMMLMHQQLASSNQCDNSLWCHYVTFSRRKLTFHSPLSLDRDPRCLNVFVNVCAFLYPVISFHLMSIWVTVTLHFGAGTRPSEHHCFRNGLFTGHYGDWNVVLVFRRSS